MPTEALLFQTGYLTIERPEPRGAEMFYRLGYPNREVRQSLNRSLLNRMTGDASRPVAVAVGNRVAPVPPLRSVRAR